MKIFLRNEQCTCMVVRRLRLVLMCMCLAIGVNVTAFAQINVSGTVSDESGDPMPGVNVVIKGTNTGQVTDLDGRYTISVPNNSSVLVFTFVGYMPKELAVGNQTTINASMTEDSREIEEVVVVGYGSMKVKDLTSAITTVKSADIAKTPAASAMQSLQGKVAGVQIVSAGKPGDGPTVRVRGVGSYPGKGETDPLYVVDGIFYDNINFLNSSDIESISVLKDASAAAIYGVRAANGVILVETKAGAYDKKPQVTFDGYYGVQRAQNVVKMANAEQFVQMVNESGSSADIACVDAAMQRYGRSRVNPNIPDVNTDWYKEIIQLAPIQSYSLDFSGGSSRAAYSIGASYQYQEGILNTTNDNQRFNLRSKLDFKATDWLTVGGNVIYTQMTAHGAEDGPWRGAYFAVPILPVYDELNVDAYPTAYSNAVDLGYRGTQNPFPGMDNRTNVAYTNRITANFYANIDLIPKKLSFKTSYSNVNRNHNSRTMLLPYYVNSKSLRLNTESNISKSFNIDRDQTWDNVLTFNHTFGGNHNLVAMAGSSYRWVFNQGLSGNADQIEDLVDHPESWYIDYAVRKQDGYSDSGTKQYAMSYFGRLAYNFKNRYLLYGTLRADGTSKYQTKWGYFPTVGAGWVISEEGFMTDVNAVNYLKLRASWGQLGNNSVPASDGAQTSTVVNPSMNNIYMQGLTTSGSYSVLGWEVVEETDLGISAKLLKNRLTIEADYYIRDTKNAVIPVAIPGTNDFISRDAGVIRNSGFELAVDWGDALIGNGDLRYNIGGNISFLKNEVRDLYGQPYLNGGSAEFRQRSYVGEPILSYYGWEVEGVWQNPGDIAANADATANGLVPGDYRYKDQNGDGKIDDNDRTILGSYLPTIIYGANLGIEYKGLELTVNLMGQYGNKILNRKRGEYIWTNDTNIDADLATNLWRGEGTSNKYPSSSGLRRSWNQKMSTYFVEDGWFFRIQNIQLAYNIKGKQLLGVTLPDIRIYLTAERPLTVFNYNGFNPEVANGDDNQVHPVPAIYTVGLNLKF